MKDEAQALINKRVNSFRPATYSQILKFMGKGSITEEVTGKSGTPYQIDIQFTYEDKKAGSVRVHGSIYTVKEAGHWWQFWKNVDTPLAYSDFTMQSDGTLVE